MVKRYVAMSRAKQQLFSLRTGVLSQRSVAKYVQWLDSIQLYRVTATLFAVEIQTGIQKVPLHFAAQAQQFDISFLSFCAYRSGKQAQGATVAGLAISAGVTVQRSAQNFSLLCGDIADRSMRTRPKIDAWRDCLLSPLRSPLSPPYLSSFLLPQVCQLSPPTPPSTLSAVSTIFTLRSPLSTLRRSSTRVYYTPHSPHPVLHTPLSTLHSPLSAPLSPLSSLWAMFHFSFSVLGAFHGASTALYCDTYTTSEH